MPSFTRRVRPGVTTSASPSASTSAPSTSAPSSSAAAPAASAPALPGTKPYPSAPTRFVSTGIPSLDDVLGHLPLSSTLTLLAPDPHTQWARLVARHVAAAGLLDGQRLLVLSPGGAGGEWVAGMPWVEGGLEDEKGGKKEGESESETEDMEDDGRTKIAWRYERMARFKTSVGSSRLAANTTLPAALRAQLEADGTIAYADAGGSLADALAALAGALAAAPPDRVVRVVVPDLGSRDWPPLAGGEIVRFLLALRALLRPRPAVAVVTLPPGLSAAPPSSSLSASSAFPSSSSQTSSAEGSITSDTSAWVAALAHASDAALTLQGFGGAPGHFRAFAPLHGLLVPHALPGRYHVLAPALRHSTLLGVRDGGEQNLGFRLKRRKFVVESVHLGIEGGTSERRTAPVESVVREVGKAEGVEKAGGGEKADIRENIGGDGVDKADVKAAEEIPEKPKKKVRARVRFGEDEVAVAVDSHGPTRGHDHDHAHTHAPSHTHGHTKPRVEIRHDRPDLYEF